MKQNSVNPLYVGEYRVTKTLGQGSYGKVKMGINDQTKEKVAIKMIDKNRIKQDKSIRSKLKKEILTMMKLKHKGILKIYQTEKIEDYFCIVIEYASGGDLFEFISNKTKISESEARNIFKQILEALEYAHSQGVSHRDLKPENILLDSQQKVIKLADFGLSNFAQDGKALMTSCGSPNYAAPEVIKGIPYDGSDSDMWSCGIILYALLTGQLPFDSENMSALFQSIENGQYYLPQFISIEAQDLINQLLQINPLKRLKAKEALVHPWFTNLQQLNRQTVFQKQAHMQMNQQGRLSMITQKIRKLEFYQNQNGKAGMKTRGSVLRTHSTLSTIQSLSEGKIVDNGEEFFFNKKQGCQNTEKEVSDSIQIQIQGEKEDIIKDIALNLKENGFVWRFDQDQLRFLVKEKDQEFPQQENPLFQIQLYKEYESFLKESSYFLLLRYRGEKSTNMLSFLDKVKPLLSSFNQ